MKRSRHWIILSVVLVAGGLAIAAYKVRELGYPVWPDETSEMWTVQAHLELDPGGGPVKAELLLPTRSINFALSNQTYVSRGWGLTEDADEWQRTAEWSIRRARGDQSLYWRGVFLADKQRVPLAPTPDLAQRPELEEPFRTALSEIVGEVRSESADIASFAAMVFSRVADSSPDDNIALFLDGPERMTRLQLARLIMADARIPTLQVRGVRLTENQRLASVESLLAVHNGQEWIAFDPVTGDRGLPRNFLVWWTGDEPLVQVTGAELETLEISVRRQTVNRLELAQDRADLHGSRIAQFSLLDLPVQTQAVYEVLLLVPIGAFLIIILRNIVGVRSFGTFMPVLIALAFRETELVAGIVLFVVIVSVGLALRFYLERLRLLLVPRLAAVLTIVLLLMAIVSILSHRLGIEVGLSVGLFPMVIIAMVIERMSVVWEEHGPANAIMDGIGSLVIAAMAYVVMGIDLFAHWVFVFPELLLVLLGVMIALGRYTGYRLAELMRFKELAR